MEIGYLEGRGHLMPANMLADGIVFLKVTNAFVTEKLKAFKALKEQGVITCKVDRFFEPSAYLTTQSHTLKNFLVNTKYNKAFSSDFLNFEFVEEAFREQLEYHTLNEFNRVRAKDFLSFTAFHQVY